MFKRILVANRGEIALRVIRACRELGIETVAIFSEADRGANYLELADEAYCVGPAKAADSYLRIDRVISAAEIGNVQAIHPGYGFLSENAHFNEVCRTCNIDFIGPTPQAMSRLGDKNEARRLAREAGVPVVPGSEGLDPQRSRSGAAGPRDRLSGADQGHGRRRRPRDARGGQRSGAEDARSSKPRPKPKPPSATPASIWSATSSIRGMSKCRFIADHHGNVVHLWERDCSMQRRHQKLIEESPSPRLPPETRAAMCEAAVRLAKTAGYTNAGTVRIHRRSDGQFLSSSKSMPASRSSIPVTEMVTGIDLIKAQIRVAAGEPLPFKQEDITARGHAIECRINAEDPRRNFQPSPGKHRTADRPRRLRRAVRFARLQRLHRLALLRLDDRQADRPSADAPRGHRLHAASVARIACRRNPHHRAAAPRNPFACRLQRMPHRHDVCRTNLDDIIA